MKLIHCKGKVFLNINSDEKTDKKTDANFLGLSSLGLIM